ncbi:hypothetical protein F4553_007707 [Allocatelliglobosispora scoriae]|uniref:Calx-beta domain-containing protein n=1 Tax=Allocatelliglobosispora scoriae TaxID=643052 RepID=A0A841C557_9ACTN|nr:Calx-beta domain-containing protein [Allocatelliglobosispora scoriae]MBB5874273.1 hypothetical protein [Allocatelliglobosispora scoriae]
MTMKSTMLRVFVAGLAVLTATIGVTTVVGQPGVATPCQRSVAIDPQATAAEAAGTLTFTVHTGSCAAAGSVSYTVTDGSARRQGDFQLAAGVLQWAAGDTSSREIRAVIVNDNVTEALLEDFTVTLVNPSSTVRIPSAVGQGRIFDNDTTTRGVTLDSRLCLLGGEPTVRMLGSTPRPLVSPTPKPVTPCTIEPGNIINVPFSTNLPRPTDQTVLFQTYDGDLFGYLDYVPVNKVVTLPAGSATVYVPVQLLPHAFTQTGKYFQIGISNYSSGFVVAGSGRVTVWH